MGGECIPHIPLPLNPPLFFALNFPTTHVFVSAANHAQSNVQSVADFGDFRVFCYHLPECRLFAAFLVNKLTLHSKQFDCIKRMNLLAVCIKRISLLLLFSFKAFAYKL